MEKRYIIIQPPFADKYTFLVDRISVGSDYGLTTDIEKINYNRTILGESFNIEIKIGLLLAEDENSVFVFDLGCFIVVFEINSAQTKGEMAFYHTLSSITRYGFYKLFYEHYSAVIAEKCLEVYDFILSDVGKTNKDIVQIFKPDFLY